LLKRIKAVCTEGNITTVDAFSIKVKIRNHRKDKSAGWIPKDQVPL